MNKIDRRCWQDIHGNVEIGEGVSICWPVDINATKSSIKIGNGADIAAFVVLNCADSSKRCIGLAEDIERAPIILGERVCVGTQTTILGGVEIGHHSIVAAHTVVRGPLVVPPYSLVIGNPAVVKAGRYLMEGT